MTEQDIQWREQFFKKIVDVRPDSTNAKIGLYEAKAVKARMRKCKRDMGYYAQKLRQLRNAELRQMTGRV